jgi:predicted MFS family arabinose efflux permease
MVRLFGHIPMNGPAFLIGTCGLAAGMFNAVVLAIFSYLYWDVVPENVMGRFNSLKATVALVAGVVWSFFIYGAAEHHMKQVYVGTGLVSLTIYLLSVWRIKEGEYPPPDPHTKGGAAAPIRAYFVECFCRPYYLWIFVASLLYQLGNLGGGYQFYFLHYDLKLDLWTIGHVEGIGRLLTAGFGLFLGFGVGIMTDRLKPMRLIGPSHLLLALAAVAGYVFISGKWSYFAVVSVKLVAMFVQGIVVGAFTVEAFPREKLGQFCSAQAVFYQFFTNICNPAVGYLFDKLHNNRIGFLWMAGFYALAAMTYVKVYHNWKKRGEHPPDPNEPQGPRGFDPVLR